MWLIPGKRVTHAERVFYLTRGQPLCGAHTGGWPIPRRHVGNRSEVTCAFCTRLMDQPRHRDTYNREAA